mgnify:CR=1 FL=1
MKSIFVTFLVLAFIPFYAISQDTIGADADKSMRIALMFGGLKNYPIDEYLHNAEGRINPVVALQVYLIEEDRIKLQTGLTFYQRWFRMPFSLGYWNNYLTDERNAGYTLIQLPFNVLYQPIRKVGLSAIIGIYSSYPISASREVYNDRVLEMGVRAGLQYELVLTHHISLSVRSEFEYPIRDFGNIYTMPSLFVLGGVGFKL